MAAAEEYRARAAELRTQSQLEQDPAVAAMFEDVAACFQQLADIPVSPTVFEPSNQLFQSKRF